MAKRLDIERQKELEPTRVQYAYDALVKAGIKSIKINDTCKRIDFFFNDEKVTLFPYSGWHTGKSIVDGRGIQKLLNQITEKKKD